jgi:DNA polymerase III alpha subunit
MRLDRFSNPIYNEQDIFDALYQGHTGILMKATVDLSSEIEKLANISHTHVLTPIEIDNAYSIADFDQALQSDWFMPEEYKLYDIVDWLYCECKTMEQKNRVTEELKAFAERDMIMLLKWLKYFVDTCEKEGVLWGVGRGSSVASYVLYLIGVHSVDSIKYNLDWREFLR